MSHAISHRELERRRCIVIFVVSLVDSLLEDFPDNFASEKRFLNNCNVDSSRFLVNCFVTPPRIDSRKSFGKLIVISSVEPMRTAVRRTRLAVKSPSLLTGSTFHLSNLNWPFWWVRIELASFSLLHTRLSGRGMTSLYCELYQTLSRLSAMTAPIDGDSSIRRCLADKTDHRQLLKSEDTLSAAAMARWHFDFHSCNIEFPHRHRKFLTATDAPCHDWDKAPSGWSSCWKDSWALKSIRHLKEHSAQSFSNLGSSAPVTLLLIEWIPSS